MFGLYGKIIVQPGQRDEMVAILLEAAGLLHDDPTCIHYVVNISPTEPDSIWITEVWSSQSAHESSLKREDITLLIGRGRPLIAGGERTEVVPLGGKGLSLE